MKLQIALARTVVDTDSTEFKGEHPKAFRETHTSNVKETEEHFVQRLNAGPHYEARRSGHTLYAWDLLTKKYIAWYDLEKEWGYRVLTPNEFLDYHPPNTRGKDFLEFSDKAKALITKGEMMILDRSSAPVVYFIERASHRVVAWFDEDDEIGYLHFD